MATTITGTTIDVGPNKLVSDSSGNVTASGVLSDPSGNVRAGRKNWIINGSVIVSQRASYATAVSMTTQAYYQDRWTTVINHGVAATIQTKSTDQPNGQVGNCIRVITSAGSSAAECCVDQRVENPQQFAGKTLTFSVWMKSNTNKAGISHYNNQDSFVAPTNHTGGGAWEKLTLTHTVNATGPTDFRLRLGMSQSGNTVVGVGDYFEVTEAQMEYGSVATDFEHRSYGEELADCQRYYCSSYKVGQYAGGNHIDTCIREVSNGLNYQNIGNFNFPVQMRTAPTLIIYNPVTGTVNSFRGDGSNYSNAASHPSTNTGCNFYTSGIAVGVTIFISIHATFNAEL